MSGWPCNEVGGAWRVDRTGQAASESLTAFFGGFLVGFLTAG
jgi:hypothetical protein